MSAQIHALLVKTSGAPLDVAVQSEKVFDAVSVPSIGLGGAALMTAGAKGVITVFIGGFGNVCMLSAPLSMLSYLNIASRAGILIKDGRSLERLTALDTIIFDKTGTLTSETPRVTKIHALEAGGEDDVLAAAAVAEHRQTHPIARAILAAAEAKNLAVEAPDAAAYTIGRGIQVSAGGREIAVGSAAFMASLGLPLPDASLAWTADAEATGASLVYVAMGGALRAPFTWRQSCGSAPTASSKRCRTGGSPSSFCRATRARPPNTLPRG
ncbi:MAG: HAD family hydrolase [Pseudomonadota bacterium]